MQVEVLTLRYDPTRGVLDDTTLREFSRDKVILAIRDHFFQVGSIPHLALVIEFRLPAPTTTLNRSNRRNRAGSARTDQLRESLPAAERELFDLLRSWRSRLARDEGIPAYAVLTNAELAAIARERPLSRAALVQIDGFGSRKAERYGEQLIAIVGQERPSAADVPDRPADG